MPNFTRSDRGFKYYEPMQTAYGHELRIYESSSADEPKIWLAVNSVHVLLTVEQARRLQDTLSACISQHYHNAPA